MKAPMSTVISHSIVISFTYVDASSPTPDVKFASVKWCKHGIEPLAEKL